MKLAKILLYNLFPYKHVARGLKKLNLPRSHYNVLAAGPAGVSVPLHICASTRNGDGNKPLPGSILTEAEIIEHAGFNIRASFERVTIRWEKSTYLLGFNQYSLYIAGERKGGGSFDPGKYELYISNLKPGTDYRLVLLDSSNRKSPVSISFKTRGFMGRVKDIESNGKAQAEGIERALQEAADSEARIKKANEAIQRVLKQRHLFKRGRIVSAALAVLEIDEIKQEEALTIISGLLDDFYPSQPKKRRAVIEQIRKCSGTFNLNGLE
jgi:hypothetical protein